MASACFRRYKRKASLDQCLRVRTTSKASPRAADPKAVGRRDLHLGVLSGFPPSFVEGAEEHGRAGAGGRDSCAWSLPGCSISENMFGHIRPADVEVVVRCPGRVGPRTSCPSCHSSRRKETAYLPSSRSTKYPFPSRKTSTSRELAMPMITRRVARRRSL
jgi:hypothetical protein